MRLNIALIFSIVIAVGIVAFGFTYYQIASERTRLRGELELRVQQIAREMVNGDSLFYVKENNAELIRMFDSINTRYSLIGGAIYFSEDSIIGNGYESYFNTITSDYVARAIAADTSIGDFQEVAGKKVFEFISPVNHNGVNNIALVLFVDADYIDHLLGDIWFRSFVRWFVQAMLITLISWAIIKWGIFQPVNKVVNWVRAARIGNLEQLEKETPAKFLAPLHNEIFHIASAMYEAKANAEEEARLRRNAESIWTAERLKVEIRNLLQDKKMIVVSNREPYMHIHEAKGIKCITPASGMITAMEPVLKACGGLWIASGTGNADRETVDADAKIQVPPEDPKYTLKRLWLSEEEEKHFYYGFSNEGLWPLCHISHTRPIFRKEDWAVYKKVNEDFAKAVLAETQNDEQPFILIQDYHFSLLPELIKREKPNSKIAIFWHIPWPNPESFGICPWQKEILIGMLGADLIGFHTQYHCNNFLETVNSALESRVLWDNFSVKIAGHMTYVKPFPISIGFTFKDFNKSVSDPGLNKLLEKYGIQAELMGIGVDRVDYTKGLIEKFHAIERFFEKNPSYIGRMTFVQIGAPSRMLIGNYSDLLIKVENEAQRINARFKSKNWKSILFLKTHHSHEEIAPFYDSANFCLVTSLHDGMNLVAKEFVAARSRNDGVLILSRFAGASQELHGAIVINPYDTEKSADAIKLALEMTRDEQGKRMQLMRQGVLKNNIYFWASSIIGTMADIRN